MIGFDEPASLVDRAHIPEQQICLAATRFMSFSKTCLDRIAPRCVMTPLVAAGHDAMDFACKLDQLDYKGFLLRCGTRPP